ALIPRALGGVLVVVTAAALAGAAGAGVEGSANPHRQGGLCDILARVVPLDCDAAPTGVGPSAPSPEGANGPDAGSPESPEAERAVLAAPVPVRRSSPEVRFDPGLLAVAFEPRTARRRIASVLEAADVAVERAIPPIWSYLVRVDPDRRAAALKSLRASPVVLSAEREPIVTELETIPNDEHWPHEWGLRVAGFPGAWELARGYAGVVVAVVDTGVDPTQPELRGALVPGYDFVNSDTDPNDDRGHGTAVAGVIAARADNRVGITGACWRCSIMPVKVLDAEGVGVDSVIAAGIVWAADHGARVINLSLGGPGTTQVLSQAIAYAVAKGAIVIGAAGNSGDNTVPFFPAADPNAVSVAGTTSSDKLYDWSNYGDWVEVAAPGCNPSLDRGGGYSLFCGTSSATPVVAGLAALAFAVKPGATPQEIEQAIKTSAFALPGLVQYGRLRAREALGQLGAAAQPSAALGSSVFMGAVSAQRRTRSYRLAVGSGPFTARLTYKTGARLSLSLQAETGRTPIARGAGSSPLQLATTAQTGRLRLTVTGGRAKTPFILTVTYVRR
ncbi:MAG: S8 family serine peptidase, partial [Gaiellaceae bacterium]